MKGIQLLIVVMSLFFILFLHQVLNNAGQISNDNAAYESEALKAEAQKKFMALRVIELDSNSGVVDAYGNPVIIGEWYVRSNVTKVLFPVEGFSLTGNYGEYNLPLVDQKYHVEEVRIKVHTGKAATVPVKVEVMLTNSTVALSKK